MKTKVSFLLAVALAFGSAEGFAQTTWVVDPGGAGDFTTVQGCIDGAAAGDTCQVNAGTYVGTLTVSKDLTLIAPDGPDATIIKPGMPYLILPVAAHVTGGTVVIDGFTLREGISTAGGGILVVNATLTVRNCLVTENYAGFYPHVPAPYTQRGGGGIYAENSTVTVEDSEISANRSYHTMFHQPRGGAIYAWGGTLTVTNCLLIGNEASHGGGAVYVTSTATAAFTNCTIADNIDGVSIGGIQVVEPAQGTVVNSILWNNEGAELVGLVTATYSDVEGGAAGTGNLDADPLFVGGGDYRLDAGSPCIDVGNNLTPGIPYTDLDGYIRIRDGDCNGVLTVDLGAYEHITSCGWGVASTVIAGDGNGQGRDSSRMANAWILLGGPLFGLFLWRRLRRKG